MDTGVKKIDDLVSKATDGVSTFVEKVVAPLQYSPQQSVIENTLDILNSAYDKKHQEEADQAATNPPLTGADPVQTPIVDPN